MNAKKKKRRIDLSRIICF